mgnify:CR=1 FL=1
MITVWSLKERIPKKIQVDGLGAGSKSVRVFGESLDKIETIEIIPGDTTTKSVKTPSLSTAPLVAGGTILVLVTLTLKFVSGVNK